MGMHEIRYVSIENFINQTLNRVSISFFLIDPDHLSTQPTHLLPLTVRPLMLPPSFGRSSAVFGDEITISGA